MKNYSVESFSALGDFDLLFGYVKLNHHQLQLYTRVYGNSSVKVFEISTWKAELFIAFLHAKFSWSLGRFCAIYLFLPCSV